MLFVATSMISCDKDDIVNPNDERFPVNYRFVNTTNLTLGALNFEVGTFYPIEYITNVTYKHFPKVDPFDTITMKIDTTGGYSYFSYIGCTTQMLVNVYFDLNDSIVYCSSWSTNIETIRQKSDSEVFFYWPMDTLKCVKVKGYTYKRYKYIIPVEKKYKFLPKSISHNGLFGL